jgi:hypothetical protein
MPPAFCFCIDKNPLTRALLSAAAAHFLFCRVAGNV